MGCLLVVIGATMPRLGMFAFWLLRPDRVDAAFDTFLLPLAGIFFVPTATLLYAVLETSESGMNGWAWFWVVVAGGFDLIHFAVNASGWKDAVSGSGRRRTGPVPPAPGQLA